MNVEALASSFGYAISRRHQDLKDLSPVSGTKARWRVAATRCHYLRLILSKELVLKDLIQNERTLFDYHPPVSPPVEAVETLPNRTQVQEFVAEWRVQVPSGLPPQPAISQHPIESEPSSTSNFPLSSATSLQTKMVS